MNFTKKFLLIVLCIVGTPRIEAGFGKCIQFFTALPIVAINYSNIIAASALKKIHVSDSYVVLPSIAALLASTRADSTIFDFPLTILGGAIGTSLAHNWQLTGMRYILMPYLGAAIGEIANMFCQDHQDFGASAGRVLILPTLGHASVGLANKLGAIR
jgi:hypothetical protein